MFNVRIQDWNFQTRTRRDFCALKERASANFQIKRFIAKSTTSKDYNKTNRNAFNQNSC